MKMIERHSGALIGTCQAARILGVHRNTIRHWAQNGILQARVLPTGARRFDPDDVERVRARITAPVVGAEVRVLAGVLAGLFDRDRELVGELNVAQGRLLGANDQVRAVSTASAELAETIRLAFVNYQHAAEDRRRLGTDVGEATIRLVDAMTAAGYGEQQARTADVWALREGTYRPATARGAGR